MIIVKLWRLILNVSTFCGQLMSPAFNDCLAFTDKAKSTLYPYQIVAISLPLAIIVWKVIYCAVNHPKCHSSTSSSSNYKPLIDPFDVNVDQRDIEPLEDIQQDKKRKVCTLKNVDNGIMTLAILILFVPLNVLMFTARSYLNNHTCSFIVQKGVILCTYAIDSLLNNI